MAVDIWLISAECSMSVEQWVYLYIKFGLIHNTWSIARFRLFICSLSHSSENRHVKHGPGGNEYVSFYTHAAKSFSDFASKIFDFAPKSSSNIQSLEKGKFFEIVDWWSINSSRNMPKIVIELWLSWMTCIQRISTPKFAWNFDPLSF